MWRNAGIAGAADGRGGSALADGVAVVPPADGLAAVTLDDGPIGGDAGCADPTGPDPEIDAVGAAPQPATAIASRTQTARAGERAMRRGRVT